jgi:hypothetical protein
MLHFGLVDKNKGNNHHSYILGEVLSDRCVAFYCSDLVQLLWQQHVHMWQVAQVAQVAQQILPVCLVGSPAATICTSTPIKFAAQPKSFAVFICCL